MRLPSKVTSYEESILPHMVFALKKLGQAPMAPSEFYADWVSGGRPPCDFMAVMDALFALGRIELDDKGRLVANAV